MRARLASFLSLLVLVCVAGLWVWFSSYTAALRPAPRFIQQEELGHMSWIHHTAEGGEIEVNLRRTDYPTVQEYRDDVAWHLTNYPPNQPP